jgi:hypothetical protein
MYEPPSGVPVPEHDTYPRPELLSAVLQRLAEVGDDEYLSFVPEQIRATA